MKHSKFGEIILDTEDLCDLLMKGRNILTMHDVTVDRSLDIESLVHFVENPGELVTWTFPAGEDVAVPEFDLQQQSHWHMPDEYREMDIAEHVLSLCQSQAELQRCGQELLLFQEKNLFDLLKYLKYLVDVMQEHRVIWGVGRGSSVSSYVLYKLGVHRIDSLHYDLDVHEFLR